LSDHPSLWALSTKCFLSYEGAKGSGFGTLWERRGRWVYYRLNLENPMLRAVLPFIEEGMEVSKIQKTACEVEP
jgi:hypothetical protein